MQFERLRLNWRLPETGFAIPMQLLMCLALATACFAQDRTKIVEDPISWKLSPFQNGGYTWPGGGSFNTEIYEGQVNVQYDRDKFCDRIDKAFANVGYKMRRDVDYHQDGVQFRLSGWDAERKVGYIWATEDALGEGYFGRESTDEAEVRLSAQEAKLLIERAPFTREHIAIIIPYTNVLGYSGGAYENKRQKNLLEKMFAKDEPKRLAAVDGLVAQYVNFVATLQSLEYPAPSKEPRNLFSYDHFRICGTRGFQLCGVGSPDYINDELAKEKIIEFARSKKVDFSRPFEYETTEGNSIGIDGYDPDLKIGFIWNDTGSADTKSVFTAEVAAAMNENQMKIAWISRCDTRFSYFVFKTRFNKEYANQLAEVESIKDEKLRLEETKKLDELVHRDNVEVPLEKLERRINEFVDWAQVQK